MTLPQASSRSRIGDSNWSVRPGAVGAEQVHAERLERVETEDQPGAEEKWTVVVIRAVHSSLGILEKTAVSAASIGPGSRTTRRPRTVRSADRICAHATAPTAGDRPSPGNVASGCSTARRRRDVPSSAPSIRRCAADDADEQHGGLAGEHEQAEPAPTAVAGIPAEQRPAVDLRRQRAGPARQRRVEPRNSQSLPRLTRPPALAAPLSKLRAEEHRQEREQREQHDRDEGEHLACAGGSGRASRRES